MEYRQILSGPDYQVFENGTLGIAQVRVSDRGSYLCQASNGVGTGLSTVINLRVHGKIFLNSVIVVEILIPRDRL